MSPFFAAYLIRSRRPWAAVAMILPLLSAYEIGLAQQAGADARTGSDAWLRHSLSPLGFHHGLMMPALVAILLILWAHLRDRENFDDPLGTIAGMVVESSLLAGLLLGLTQLVFPLLAHGGGVIEGLLALSLSAASSVEATWGTLLRFVGAGIYEELLFRGVLFSALRLLFLAGDVRETTAGILAAIGSALMFAAAHHLGGGEASLNVVVFLYRVMAGLYFAAIFQFRGLGVAVGAHVGYDVLVGLVLHGRG